MRIARTRLILFAVAAIVVVGLVLGLTGNADRTTEPSAEADNIEVNIETAEPPRESLAPRAIAPEQFAIPFAENAADLERIEPRQPLTPPRPTGPKLTRLHQPVPTAAGLVQFPDGMLRFADIEVLDPQSVCIDIAGTAWPCGLIGRTAFRNYLRGRALSCVVPESRWTETVVTRCQIGQEDPAAWLVSRGWVRAVPGSDYEPLERAAREEQKGIYGSDPRGGSPVADSGVDVAPLPDLTVTPQPGSQPEPSQ